MNNPMKGSYWIVCVVVAVAIGLYAVVRVSAL